MNWKEDVYPLNLHSKKVRTKGKDVEKVPHNGALNAPGLNADKLKLQNQNVKINN